MPKDNGDLIGTITTSNGEALQIFMPTMLDLEPLLTGELGNENAAVYIARTAARLTRDQWNKLSMPDGLKVLGKIQPALEAMNAYTANQNLKK